MVEIAINAGALALVGGVRARAGAKKGESGEYAEDDMEVVVSVQMGCARPTPLVGPDGKARGVMVPVGELVCPLGEFKKRALMRLGGQEIAASVADAVRL